MDDAAFEAQQARVVAAWGRWREILGINEWVVHHSFHDGPYIDQNKTPFLDAAASVIARWEYREAAVNWNLQEIAGLSDERLDGVVVHEAMHIVLDEMHPTLPPGYERDENDSKHEERVCQTLAWAFQSAREAGRGEASNGAADA